MPVAIEPFRLPLSDPLATADGEIVERSGFLVRVGAAATDADERGDETEDGGHGGEFEAGEHDGRRGTATAVGVGEATPLPGWTESLDRCRRALEAAAEEFETAGPDAALAALDDAPAARHGLELALADRRARRAERPLYRHLRERVGIEGHTADVDGPPVRQVPVNATIGDGAPAAVAERARAAVDGGASCLKLKVGARSLAADEHRVRAVRDAVGDDVALRLDANGAWDLDAARDALDRLASYEPEYVEQPLPAGSLDDLAGLADRDVALALDESVAAIDLDTILAADVADVLVCKPQPLGGPVRTVAVAERARAAGLDVVVSTTIDGVVARTAAVHVAAALSPIRPSGLATGGLLAADLAPDPAPIEDGRARVPQAPGTGVVNAAIDATPVEEDVK